MKKGKRSALRSVFITGVSGYFGQKLVSFFDQKREIKSIFGIDITPPHFIPKKKFYIIDSLRAVSEHRYLQHKFGKKYVLIGVTADRRLRQRREIERARFGERITKKNFEKRDMQEERFGVKRLIRLADYKINANKDIPYLYLQVDKLYKRLSKGF